MQFDNSVNTTGKLAVGLRLLNNILYKKWKTILNIQKQK